MKAKSRRWLPLTVLSLAAVGLTAVLVSIAVGEHAPPQIRVQETGEVQQLIAGIPQLDDRLGEDDASVTIDLFLDVQCPSCAEYTAEVIDPVIEDFVRTGQVKIILHHRPVGVKGTTLGAFATIAAAQQDRGWQYAEIFMRNLNLVPESGVADDYLNEIAGVTPKLDLPLWEEDLDREDLHQEAEDDDRLAAELEIPAATALVIANPETGFSETLFDSPSLEDVLDAIARAQ